MAVFRINYPQVLAQAAKMEHLATEVQQRVQQLEAAAQYLRSHWEGPASVAYLGKNEALRLSMLQTAREMHETAQKSSALSCTSIYSN